MRHTLGVLVLFVVASAQAAPVTWEVNATFRNAQAIGTLTGTFNYDADLNAYSAVNLQSTCTNVTPYCVDYYNGQFTTIGPEREWSPPLSSTVFYTTAVNANGSGVFVTLSWLTPLSSSAGNSYPLLYSSQIFPEVELYYVDNSLAQYATLEGTISSVPLPAAVWLFGSGLALLGLSRKKRA